MKYFWIFTLLTLITTTDIHADCSSSGIRVFPRTEIISTNPIFIVEGYAFSQSVINQLNQRNSIYLTSGNDRVSLKVIKTIRGQFSLTQALLKPTTELISGRHYKLNIDSLDEYEQEDFLRDNIGWTVSNEADNTKPIWQVAPSYKSKGMIFYGCGPAVLVNFCACISDNTPVVVYTKVKNIKTNSIADYYINPDSSYLELGHGMCSGAFDFEDGQEYEVTFLLMDASGNTSETETHPIKFISPTEKDQINHDDKVDCNCPPIKQTTEQIQTDNHNYLLWTVLGAVMLTVLTFIIIKRKTRHDTK
jgi:hypothetical protein